MRLTRAAIAALGMVVACAMTASAQTTVVLPDTSQTTTVSVTVGEQARIAVPSGVTFNVSNIGASTAASAAAVTIDQVVLGTATKQLRLSLKANAANFTPPVAGATTWAAGDVTWNAATWTAATSSGGTLNSSTYNIVATCNPGAAACSTTGLVFTLGSKATVQRSGTHTLVVTWKVEAIGS